MKIRFLTFMLIMLSVSLIPVISASTDELDLPPSGTDINNFRCKGKIVGVGADTREVNEICGDPLSQGRMINRNYDTIWVYLSDSGQAVHYLAFRNRRLERIYRVDCKKNDPHCP